MDKRRNTFAVVLLSGLIPFVGACSSEAAGPGEGNVSSRSGALMASPSATLGSPRLVRAEADNVVTVSALPSAACVLRSSDTAPGDPGIDVVTDEEGMVSFPYRPLFAGTTVSLSLDCQDSGGSTATHSVQLRAQSDAPALVAPAPHGVVRPPLTADPLALTQGELMARGFPPRPDPQKAPDRYSHWLKLVSQPRIVVLGKPVPVPRKRFAAQGWGGYSTTTQPGTGTAAKQGPFEEVWAEWQIPSVLGVDTSATNDVVFWVGVGGAFGFGVDPGSLWQAGSEHQVLPIKQSGRLVGKTVKNNYWYEFVEFSGEACCAPWMWYGPVDSGYGDYLSVGVYLTDASGNLKITNNNSTQYVSYYIDDATLGAVFVQTFTVQNLLGTGAGPTILGNSAEWIAEHVTGLPLTHFSDVAMTDCYYFDRYSGEYLTYRSNAGAVQWTMTNSASVALEAAAPTSSTTITHHWLRSK